MLLSANNVLNASNYNKISISPSMLVGGLNSDDKRSFGLKVGTVVLFSMTLLVQNKSRFVTQNMMKKKDGAQ